jgi:predicted PurR-regulated permease PerM
MTQEKSIFNQYALLAFFIILLVVGYFIIKPFLLALFLAALLAYTLHPIYRKLKHKTKKPSLSSFIVTIGVFILMILPAGYFANVLVRQSYLIYIIIKQRLATGIFQGCTAQFCETLTSFLQTPEIVRYITDASNTITQYFIQSGSTLIFSIPRIVINLFIFLFVFYYLLRDGKKLIRRIGYYLSVQKKMYAIILQRLTEVTKGIVYGYLLIALMQGVLGGLGFFLAGLPSPIFWGIIMAFLALFPFAGTGIVWAPAGIILIINGLTQDSTFIIVKGIALLIYGALIVSSLDNFLRPKLVSEKAKIHPAIILVGIFGGLIFFGTFGVIIGPMVLSLAAIIIETYLGKEPSENQMKNILDIIPKE